MTDTHTNEKALNEILTTLNRLPDFRSKLEVLANVFMIYGVTQMGQDSNLPDKITPENVVQLVLDDVEKKGNTIGNSLALQGVTILAWLEEQYE